MPSVISNLITAIVLFVVVFFNNLVTYFKNKESSDVMNKFKNLLPPKCKVLRDGKE